MILRSLATIALGLVVLALAAPAHADCVWGNCQNGRGTWRHEDGSLERGVFKDGALVESRGRMAAPAEKTTKKKKPGAHAREELDRRHGKRKKSKGRSDRTAGCLRGSCVHGKGVRQYADGSNYDGDFRNGIRHGKGVQTWPDGRRYEGSWSGDRRHGYGVQTWRDGRFVGTWSHGEPTSAGVRTYDNGDRYVGAFRAGVRHGRGTLTHQNGDRYVGGFRRDRKHGEGTWYAAGGGKKEGRWVDGQYMGKAGSRIQPGLVAGGSGCVSGNCWDGRGRFVYEDGREFVGTFRKGKPHGRGSMTHPDGRVDSGRWEEGKRWGRRVIATPGAVAKWKAQEKYKSGCLSGNCRDGKGSYRWSDGSTYRGGFQDSRPHGQGAWSHPDGSRYEGGWRLGNRDGRGMERTAAGVERTGVWREGRFVTAGVSSTSRQSRVRLRWPDLSRPAPKVSDGGDDAAVVVGIERYAHVAKIPGANQNATAWYDYLVRTRGVPVENVSLLLDADATREDIQWAVDEAAQQVGDDGTLWFVFIGHGAPSRDQQDGLLVGYDAQQKARSIEARSLGRADLLGRLESSSADSIRVLLDACFSGRAADGEQLVAGLQPLVVTSDTRASDPRTMLFTAARNDEYAGPLPGGDRPAFSYLALGGLRGWADGDGNGRVTAGELHGYVRTVLRALVRDRRQRNTLYGDADVDLARKVREKGPELSRFVAKLAGGGPASSR